MPGPDSMFPAASSTVAKDLRAAKATWSKRMLRPVTAKHFAARARGAGTSPAPTQNVVGVGIGEKMVDGKPAGVPAIKFFVRIKFPEAQLDAGNALPRTIDGLAVDVEETGAFRRLPARASAAAVSNPRKRMRPAHPGCSIGFGSETVLMAGTLGGVVKKGGSLYILSNNHVLADENRLPIGSPIFQPGTLDGGDMAKDQIAELSKFVALKAGVMNTVDCAIAKAVKSSLLSKEILHVGAPAGKTEAQIDMVVHKFGRTTSYRAGRITSVATDVSVEYATGIYTFEDQIIVVGLNGQPFSDDGDSGSLILERSTQKAVGLLCAGSASHSIANHIGSALTSLGVTLA
jgi:S1-C subfamily serine protease